MKEKDSIYYKDQWYEIINNRSTLYIRIFEKTIPRFIKISDIEDEIAGHKKYVPSISYAGATINIESYVKDGSTLIYLETSGEEMSIKSVTSVLMQGRVRQNDSNVISDTLGFIDINKQGNKRKMKMLENGFVHSILYHSPSISDVNFNVLIGRTQDELFESFERWLIKSQPMPYPPELTKELYIELKEKDYISELTSHNINAIKISEDVVKENYLKLQEAIIDVCFNNGLIKQNAKPKKQKAPLPASTYLSKNQVQKIMDTLELMPKTYELENIDIKPIGLKLFCSNMTLYITEADKGSEDDEYENMQTQCFGYIKNESDPMSSEWGYINVPYFLEMEINHHSTGFNGSFKSGFEQDLYFEDMYINSDGVVGKLEDLEKIA